MSEHRWSYCSHCMTAMVLCGRCGNNSCNGGTGDDCPDECADARAFEAANAPPADLQARGEADRKEWEALTETERDARNQQRFDASFAAPPTA